MDHTYLAINIHIMKISDLAPIQETKLTAVMGKITRLKPKSAHDAAEQNILMHRSPKAKPTNLGE